MLSLLILDAIIGITMGNLAYFVSLFITLIALWASRFNWSEFGLSKPNWGNSILKALGYSVGIFAINDIILQPLIELFVGEIDLSSLDGLRGNFANYVIMLLLMWVVAAFGEELIYRGYFVKRIAGLFGNTETGWYISALLVAIGFGIAHMYQGPAGMITTGFVGFIFAWIFIRNKSNLWVAMLTHGFYDVIGITMIYLDSERVIVDAIQEMLS